MYFFTLLAASCSAVVRIKAAAAFERPRGQALLAVGARCKPGRDVGRNGCIDMLLSVFGLLVEDREWEDFGEEGLLLVVEGAHLREVHGVL
jgi:hypothetical protein